jgi:hypothetical protein
MPEKPLHFPMKFKVFLRLAFGGRLHADKLRNFRKYWRVRLKDFDRTKDMSEENRGRVTDASVNLYVRDGVSGDFYKANIDRIKDWRKENMRQQRVDAARKRWRSKKLKNKI